MDESQKSPYEDLIDLLKEAEECIAEGRVMPVSSDYQDLKRLIETSYEKSSLN